MRITCSLSLVVKLVLVLVVAGLIAGFYLGNRSASARPPAPSPANLLTFATSADVSWA